MERRTLPNRADDYSSRNRDNNTNGRRIKEKEGRRPRKGRSKGPYQDRTGTGTTSSGGVPKKGLCPFTCWGQNHKEGGGGANLQKIRGGSVGDLLISLKFRERAG